MYRWLCAFDLLELDGRDLRREPIEQREHLLESECASGETFSRDKLPTKSGMSGSIRS
jgi:ATP-dependent DNA ligase